MAGHKLLSLTASLTEPVPAGSGLAVRGFASVNNLANRRYIASAFLNPDVVKGVPVAFEPGAPREFVVGVTLEAR